MGLEIYRAVIAFLKIVSALKDFNVFARNSIKDEH